MPYKTIFTIDKPYNKPITEQHYWQEYPKESETSQLIENYSIIYGVHQRDISTKLVDLENKSYKKASNDRDFKEFYFNNNNAKEIV